MFFIPTSIQNPAVSLFNVPTSFLVATLDVGIVGVNKRLVNAVPDLVHYHVQAWGIYTNHVTKCHQSLLDITLPAHWLFHQGTTYDVRFMTKHTTCSHAFKVNFTVFMPSTCTPGFLQLNTGWPKIKYSISNIHTKIGGKCFHYLINQLLFVLCFVLFLLRFCIFSFMYIICFVCTSVRTTATEWKLNCSDDDDNNNNNF